jgi:L-iditol 2-dehydrogenase
VKAAVYRGVGKPLSIEDIAEPRPRPDDVVIRVHRCGVCGTDLHVTSHPKFGAMVGSVLGHEYAGEVVEIGSAVTNIKVGDRVSALPSRGCGRCEACRRGNLVLCSAMPGEMGGFGEYLRAQAKCVTKLPSTLSMADGALIEPLAVSLWGARLANIQPGDRILVLGGGTVALTTIYWARRLGARRIVAVSRDRRRAEMALAMGADAFVAASEGEVAEVADGLGAPPEIVFECIGVPGQVARGVDHVAQFGQVVCLGFCTSQDSFVPAGAGKKGVTLKFSLGYSMPDFEYAVAVMATGHVDPKTLITSVVTLDELPAKFEELRHPHHDTKVHVVVSNG